MTENKKQRFDRVSGKRLLKIKDEIRKLGNCSSAAYEFAEEDASRIQREIFDAMKEVELKFAKRLSKMRK